MHSLIRLTFLWLLLAPSLILGQDPLVTGSDEPSQEIRWQVQQLSDPSYSTRQLAYWRLVRQGAQVIPALEEALPNADADAAERIIRILSELAIEPNAGPGPAALAALRRAANPSITLYGTLASRSLESLGMQQQQVVQEELKQLGVFVGFRDLQILTSQRPQAFHVQINESFLGTVEDLDRLQWMVGVNVLVLDGPQVTGDWLKCVALMPNLKTLQIKHASLKDEDIAQLVKMDHLEVLELIYVPIGDDAISHLKKLPITVALRLFGTQISANRFADLRESLGEIETLFGRGGYLGVKILQSPGVVIQEATRGGAAAAAGLLRNDQIMKINSTPLIKFEDLRKELANYAPGESIEVTFERPEIDPDNPNAFINKTHVVSITLGEQL